MPQKRILPYVIMGILLNKDCTGKQIMDEFRFDIGERRNGSSSKCLYVNYINGFGSCETSYGGRLVAFYLDYSEKMVSSHLDFAA